VRGARCFGTTPLGYIQTPSLLLSNGTNMDERMRVRVHINGLPYTSSTPVSPLSSYLAPPVTSLETTSSRGHAWPKGRGAPKTDLGGNFTTMKTTSLLPSSAASYKGSGFGYTYEGVEYAYSPRSACIDSIALVAPTSDVNLEALGTKAIARCIPTNPVADGAVFLGELKEGLPRLVGKSLFKSKLKDYRKIGDEYLNIEFGWKPFVSDLTKFANAVSQSEKIKSQLYRDSGKNIRRKYTFPVEVSNSVTVLNNRVSSLATGNPGYAYLYKSPGGSKLTVTTNVETKTWFSGCFTYHLAPGKGPASDLNRQAAEIRKLSGLELTPEVVWNLIPWSWAVDWDASMGDFLHNLSRFQQDGLVMRYGYIMQQKTAVVSYNLAGGGRLDTAPSQDLQLTVTSQSKVRRRATPFGFGINMNSLNGRQLSILGALGISRGPRHL